MKTKQLKFKVGDRVSHKDFGNGTIIQVANTSAPDPYQVILDNEGMLWWSRDVNLTLLEPSEPQRFMCITRVCGNDKVWLIDNNKIQRYGHLCDIPMFINAGYVMISESEFMQKFPPKPEPLKLFGYDVTAGTEYVRVGCKTYSFADAHTFVRIAQDLINVVADNIINEIDIIKIKETLKKLQS